MSIFRRVGDVTQAMGGGGVLVNVLFTPLQEILYPRLHMHIFLSVASKRFIVGR